MVKFDPFSREFHEDPYATYDALRAAPELPRGFGMWLLTRYDDVIGALRDRRLSSKLIPDTVAQLKPAVSEGTDYIDGFMKKAIVFTEEPDHARLRRLVRDCFDAKSIEEERPKVRGIVADVLASLRGRDSLDVMEEFADQVPLRVNCERLGIPEDMRVQVRDWAYEVRFLLDPGLLSPRTFGRVQTLLNEFALYARTLVEEREANKKDDVISRMLASRHGEDRLSVDEVILLTMMTFVAGHETTKYLIGNGLLALAQHPEQAEKLRAQPDLAEQAVDEVLRYNCPLQATKRIAIEDIKIRDTTIKTGDKVLIILGAANRDPAKFPEPSKFDISRPDLGHVGLGYGMRACLGGSLATCEAQEALTGFVQTFRRFEPTSERLDWQNKSRILHGVDHLPMLVSSSA